jgi:excisionase family DNA binding protein
MDQQIDSAVPGHDGRATYDAQEFFRLLGVSKNSGYEALKRGEIPSIRIGGRYLIPKCAGDRLLGR